MKRIMFSVKTEDCYELKHITTKLIKANLYKCHGNEVLEVNTDDEYLVINTDKEFRYNGQLINPAREWARLIVGYYLTADNLLIAVTEKTAEAWTEPKEHREIREGRWLTKH